MQLPDDVSDRLMDHLDQFVAVPNQKVSICEVCGNRNFLVKRQSVAVFEPNPALPLSGGVECAAMVCQSCGNVRLFDLSVATRLRG